MDRLTVGMIAHVDAGKTTLSEALLYYAGIIRKVGRVDHGDTLLDHFAVERERGITVFSKQAQFSIGSKMITLLDTPGHVDFSPETERTLQVLDAAILVISGSEGIQSHTMTMWHLLETYRIPVFIFINKTDLAGVDVPSVITGIRKRFGDGCVDFSKERNEKDILEDVSVADESLLELALSGSLTMEHLPKAIQSRKVFPVFHGSALKFDGIDCFANSLATLLPSPVYPSDFSARVFKITTDEQNGRLTHLKITGGTLHVKDTVPCPSNAELIEKINRILIPQGPKLQPVQVVEAGTVCLVSGLSFTHPGQGLGNEKETFSSALAPVLIYHVQLPGEINPQNAFQCLKKLEDEDPSLHIEWHTPSGEIQIHLMGDVQQEILQKLILNRFGFQVHFLPARIALMETIATPVEGIGHYEPLKHYAEVHLILEPLPAGSGLVFCSSCSENMLDRNWQRLVLTHLAEKQHIGVLTGSPITDIKITLTAGRAHLKHTEGGDFRQATYRAVRQGLRSAVSVLLEPWYSFTLLIPSAYLGRAMTDLERMHAEFSVSVTTSDTALLSGEASVREFLNYQNEVTEYTHGVGRCSCIPSGYRPSANPELLIEESGYQVDADVENSADSVFCDHGAGFNVRWYDVPKYMHLEPTLKPVKASPLSPKSSADRSDKARDPFEEDAELLRIFERTYGPIKQNPFLSFRSQSVATAKLPDAVEKTVYVLVDGYNILFAWPELKKIAETGLDAARSRLSDILCSYAGYTDCRLILVFDAYRVKNNPGEIENYGNILIVYTKEAETADSFIEKATYTLAKERIVRVATSDGPEQMIILGNGATRIPADTFHEEVLSVERAILAMLGGKGAVTSLGALSSLSDALNGGHPLS